VGPDGGFPGGKRCASGSAYGAGRRGLLRACGIVERTSRLDDATAASSPAARVSCIDVRDHGDVTAKVLTERGHQGQAYQLTGPEALNDDDVAARLSDVLGRTVAHVQAPWEAVRESLAGMGFPTWGIDGLKELNYLYETGVAVRVSPDTERLLGRPPRGFIHFAADCREAFGG
jgi:uncharacterized protein YbjT (DUF2867 family)